MSTPFNNAAPNGDAHDAPVCGSAFAALAQEAPTAAQLDRAVALARAAAPAQTAEAAAVVWWPKLAWGVAACAAAGVAWLALAPASHVQPLQEHALQLPEAGPATATLALATHHHNQGSVHRTEVEAAPHVEVQLAGAERHGPPKCDAKRCRHTFGPVTGKQAHRLTAQVATAGRHEIAVRHHSRRATVHERFIVVAER